VVVVMMVPVGGWNDPNTRSRVVVVMVVVMMSDANSNLSDFCLRRFAL
jgi:hypothetical protein